MYIYIYYYKILILSIKSHRKKQQVSTYHFVLDILPHTKTDLVHVSPHTKTDLVRMSQIWSVFLILYSNPVFLFLLSTFCIINLTIFSFPIIISNFFALVIPVYNKFLVNNTGAAGGITIITTSNSLPLCFMYCNCVTVFYLI